jgi:homoprotocatechuate degradation regulator HpaR
MTNSADLLYGQDDARNRAPDAYHALPVKLHQTREAFANHFRPIFLEYDLTDPQWRVLRILSAVEQIDTAALAKRSLLLGPSLSRILRDLHVRKLITRMVSEEDGRRSFHAITATGRLLISQITPQFATFYERISAAMSEDEVATLNALLDRVASTVASIEGPASQNDG